MTPEVRYVVNDGAHLAYQVWGEGDRNLVLVPDGPTAAIRGACAIREATAGAGLEVRIGLHSGEIEIIGDDIGGIAVHIAARVGALAGEGEILTSRTVKDLVAGSGIAFEPRGLHTLKGVPDEWEIMAVAS